MEMKGQLKYFGKQELHKWVKAKQMKLDQNKQLYHLILNKLW